MRYLTFFRSYINAPAGDIKPPNLSFLENIICRIGRKYSTIKGSELAKGKHYIKNKIPSCKGRHIKLMIRSVDNVLVRNENDLKYVWRFNIYTYTEIFRLIVSFIEDNKDSLLNEIKNELTTIALEIPSPKMTYSELLIRKPLIGLNTVAQDGNNEKVRNSATEVRDKIRNFDKSYNIEL